MTFEEIAIFGQENGFRIGPTKEYYLLTLERKDSINVELSFPNDQVSLIMKDGYAISWDYRLIDHNTQNIIYKDWLEHYGSHAEELLREMKEDIKIVIDKLSTLEIRIYEKPIFTIFGWKIGKSTVLNVKTEQGWQTIWGDAA